jgi:hypothetical protein
MVSSAIDMDLQELLNTLERFRREYADDPEYARLRSELPAEWPILARCAHFSDRLSTWARARPRC